MADANLQTQEITELADELVRRLGMNVRQGRVELLVENGFCVKAWLHDEVTMTDMRVRDVAAPT